MKILLSQKNRFFEIIQSNIEVRLNQFEFGEYEGLIQIEFKNSEFKFLLFDRDRNNRFKIVLVPGEYDYENAYSSDDWEVVYQCFEG